MIHVTTPDDHSPVKSPPFNDPIAKDIEQESNSAQDNIDSIHNPTIIGLIYD